MYPADNPEIRCSRLPIGPTDRPRLCVGGRDLDNDELRLGVVDEVFYAKKNDPVPGAQWTGIITSIAVEMLPVMLMFSANLWAGMSALQLSSVPVYQTLKRMTPLPAMALDFVLRGKRFSAPVCCSVLVVCFGAFLTGCGDLDINARGYAFACASCIARPLLLAGACGRRCSEPSRRSSGGMSSRRNGSGGRTRS